MVPSFSRRTISSPSSKDFDLLAFQSKLLRQSDCLTVSGTEHSCRNRIREVCTRFSGHSRVVLSGRLQPGTTWLSRTREPALAKTPRPTSSRTIPRIKDVNTTVIEVCYIARRELGPSHLGNGHCFRIRAADGSAGRTAVSGKRRKKTRCVTLQPDQGAARRSRYSRTGFLRGKKER